MKDLARTWPGAERIRAPLKALDRLLGNRHLNAEREHVALGWHWLGRLRHRTHVNPVDAPEEPSQWVSCKAMYELATCHPRDFGLMHTVHGEPLTACVVLHAKPPKGRKHRNRQGVPARNSNSCKNAQRESEP